ncbi:chain-length determining protein [Limosilactobacillus mucosae]|nr:chain-length determining protein [Limosilactobacillus mucosae]
MKEYSVKDLKSPFVKAFIFTIIMAILGGVVMIGVAKHKKHTTYTAERYVLISHKMNSKNGSSTGTTNSVTNDDINMMTTYEEIARNEEISQAARKHLSKSLRKKYTTTELSDDVKAKTQPQSLVMSLSVTTDNPKDAVKLVNAVAEGLKEKLPKIQPGSGSVKLMAKANQGDVKSMTTPHTKKYAVVGLALGGLLGMIISFVAITWKRIID